MKIGFILNPRSVCVCCDFRRVLTSWGLEIRTQKIEFTARDVFDTRHNIWYNIAQDKFSLSRHSLILTNILLKGLVLARRSNKYTAQD